jgi:SAM-dependent methyltransferase
VGRVPQPMRYRRVMAAGAVRPLSSARRSLSRAVRSVLGPRFVRHYLSRRPAALPPRAGDLQSHGLAGTLSDAFTIKAGFSPLRARYHYNGVENSILEYVIEHPLPSPLHVLDVGSGAGHWIDFYRGVLGAEHVTGLELDSDVAAALIRKYEGDPGVSVHQADVVDALPVPGPFSVVNAIGVMFHIVDDERWEIAVGHCARVLEPGGLLIVGGQFGPVSHDVGFRARLDGGGVEVFKRLRSRRRWRSVAERAGLRDGTYVRTRRTRHFDLPEANLMVFRRP